MWPRLLWLHSADAGAAPKGVDRWCVGGWVQLQNNKKKKRKGEEIMKEKYCHKNSKTVKVQCAQGLCGFVCTSHHSLSLPGLLHCLISSLITFLSFYRPHCFCGCTHGDAHMHRSSMCFLLFFLPFLYSLGITSTLINITGSNIPFPFLAPPLLFHHLPLPYLLSASVFVPAGLTYLSSFQKTHIIV